MSSGFPSLTGSRLCLLLTQRGFALQHTTTGERLNDVHIFNFETMAWSEVSSYEKVRGAAPQRAISQQHLLTGTVRRRHEQ
jgi:hypothetical protein